jgi:tetratricopeptide (TPR) repeat protein
MQCYRQALDLDPDFALPHVGMVECYNTLAVFHLMPQRPAREASIKHAEQALFLDPHSADTQFAFGYTQFYMHWNWRLAEMAFDRALATNPNHVLALCFLSLLLCALQRWEESHRLAVTATRLDPFSPLSWSLRSVASFYRRDPGDALAAAEHGLELNPEDLLSRWIRADSVVRLGPSPRALDMVHDLDARTDEQPLFNALAGVLYGLLGERSETLRIWEKLKSYTHADPFLCSLLSVHLHDPEEALDHLEQTESEGEAAFYTIGCLPYFDPLRRHPRFVRLLERLGLDGR